MSGMPIWPFMGRMNIAASNGGQKCTRRHFWSGQDHIHHKHGWNEMDMCSCVHQGARLRSVTAWVHLAINTFILSFHTLKMRTRTKKRPLNRTRISGSSSLPGHNSGMIRPNGCRLKRNVAFICICMLGLSDK